MPALLVKKPLRFARMAEGAGLPLRGNLFLRTHSKLGCANGDGRLAGDLDDDFGVSGKCSCSGFPVMCCAYRCALN